MLLNSSLGLEIYKVVDVFFKLYVKQTNKKHFMGVCVN